MSISSGRRKLRGIILDTGEDGGSRCSACDASCCKGFPRVELTAEEYSVFENIEGSRIEFTLDGRFFLVIEGGCDYLIGNRCSIYEIRPDICRRFTCSDV